MRKIKILSYFFILNYSRFNSRSVNASIIDINEIDKATKPKSSGASNLAVIRIIINSEIYLKASIILKLIPPFVVFESFINLLLKKVKNYQTLLPPSIGITAPFK